MGTGMDGRAAPGGHGSAFSSFLPATPLPGKGSAEGIKSQTHGGSASGMDDFKAADLYI
jgi:hypothetical protein